MSKSEDSEPKIYYLGPLCLEDIIQCAIEADERVIELTESHPELDIKTNIVTCALDNFYFVKYEVRESTNNPSSRSKRRRKPRID